MSEHTILYGMLWQSELTFLCLCEGARQSLCTWLVLCQFPEREAARLVAEVLAHELVQCRSIGPARGAWAADVFARTCRCGAVGHGVNHRVARWAG